MTDNNKNPWQTLRESTVYENKWIKVTHADVITPTGTEGIYGKVHFKNKAIGIIPLDDDGYTWLIGQYRYALNTYSWEIPEGGGPLEMDTLEAAKRELAEEVGLAAADWQILAELNTSNSVTDEYGIIFLARNLSAAYAPTDDTELLKIKKVHITEAFRMAMRGEIMDSMSLIGLFKLQILMNVKMT